MATEIIAAQGTNSFDQTNGQVNYFPLGIVGGGPTQDRDFIVGNNPTLDKPRKQGSNSCHTVPARAMLCRRRLGKSLRRRFG